MTDSRIAYLDTPSGISGDMFLGCLVDAGWPLEELRRTAAALKLPGEWSISARPVAKGPLRALLVEVVAKEGHVHRRLEDIRAIIQGAELSESVKARSSAVFARLAAAEAKVHGTSIDQIHFHEVGAVDAIIDIVGTVSGLEALGVTKLYASPLPMGSGWGNGAHGQLPMPAPAVLELLAAAKVPVCPPPGGPGQGELVTPTGAALLAELADFRQPAMTLERIGIGAGRRDCPWPNAARLWLGTAGNGGALVELATNIDDMNPQLYDAVMDKLFAAGARDVWLTPVQMKKNRPGIVLSVLADAAQEAALTAILLRETTTLGVRVHAVHRHEAQREFREVEVLGGTIRIKLKLINGEIAGAQPEYEDCRALADQLGLPVKMVWEQAVAAGAGMNK
jgi:uncharacterized protein (TIGR00299 family) protein